MTQRKDALPWVMICAALALCTAWAATGVVLYSRNSLLYSGDWVSAKTLMQVHMLGTNNFIARRNALQGGRLNLTEWHGHNELNYRHPVSPAQISLRVLLAKQAQLLVGFNRHPGGWSALRLSRSELHPPAFLRVERSGKFSHKRLLPRIKLGKGWHQVKLTLAGGRLEVQVNDTRVLVPGVRPRPNSFVLLRSGLTQTRVDDYTLRDATGRVIFSDDFENQRWRWPVLAALLALLLPIFLLPLLVARRRPPEVFKRHVMAGIMGQMLLLFLVLAFGFFDRHLWSPRYPYDGTQAHPNPTISDLLVGFEKARGKLFGVFRDQDVQHDSKLNFNPAPGLLRSMARHEKLTVPVGNNIISFSGTDGRKVAILPDEQALKLGAKKPGAMRLGLMGGSQTVGVGAENIFDTLAAVTQRQLTRVLGARQVEVVNYSSSGDGLEHLTERFAGAGVKTHPELLVANVSCNEVDQDTFGRSLVRIQKLTREAGIRLVLSLEGNTLERDLPELKDFHQQMRAFAKRHGLAVLDLHGYLGSAAVKDSGLLWWDHVHLSSYGQGLAGVWLARQLAPLVTAR